MLYRWVLVALIFLCCQLSAATASRISGAQKIDPALARFIAEKRDLTKTLAKKHEVEVPKIVWNYFDSAAAGDWNTTSNLFNAISASSGRDGGRASLPTQLWTPVHDTFGAYEQFRVWNNGLLKLYSDKIIGSIPEGSIYFGGTDPGRFVISAMTRHTEGKPFYTLTQNALADNDYLLHLSDIYGRKIRICDTNDSTKAFSEYLADAQKRHANKQLKPGEDVRIVNGRVQVSGTTAVMAINELLVQSFLRHNGGKEFFMEESYPLENLYPHSLPHGLLLRLRPEPVAHLPGETLKKDQQFWGDLCQQLVGNRIEMGNERLAEWAMQRYTSAQPSGNADYDAKEPGTFAFSKCRTAIASLYAWRGKNTEDKHLTAEADRAYKQSWALAPHNPEVSWRYADFLLERKQTNDARVVLKTTVQLISKVGFTPDTEQQSESLERLKQKEAALNEKK